LDASLTQLLLLAVVAFVAAAVAAVSGFGGAALLLPVVVATFGVRDAIPILTVAQLIGNAARVGFNRRQVDWRVVAWFAAGGVPAAFLGGLLFAAAPLGFLKRLLGVFLLGMVAWRRLRKAPPAKMRVQSFAGLGVGFSFLSALFGSVGPIMAPFFLAYGLVKGAYIGTEAMATVVMHVTKLLAYGQTGVLSGFAVWAGLALGPVMIGGSYAGKRIVDRLPEQVFVRVVETVLIAAGVLFLLGR
jgi:uncharacterized membrane protein YfcA